MLYVNVVHEGISPEDAERLISKPLEKELRAIEGVKEMTATAHLGGANVVLEFDAGLDADQARLDGRETVELAKAGLDCKSVGGGKSVAGRVVKGCRRLHKKNIKSLQLAS